MNNNQINTPLKEKDAQFQMDNFEKPLEQTSIIIPTSGIKEMSESNQNSSSKKIQMSINSKGEKISNMSNEYINIQEFQNNENVDEMDINVPSEENDNEEEFNPKIENITKITTTKKTIKTVLKGVTNLSDVEINKKINENTSNLPMNVNIFKKTIKGPTITTTQIITTNNDGTKIVTKTEKFNNINDFNIKNENKLPSILVKSYNTERKEIKGDRYKDENDLNNNFQINFHSENKKHKNSENEEKNRTQKILFGSDMKYDFDYSQNEDDDKILSDENNFKSLDMSPMIQEKVEEIKEHKNFKKMELKQKINNNISGQNNDKIHYKNQLKESIQTSGSVSLGVNSDEKNNFSSNNNSQINTLKNSQNNVSSFVYKNENNNSSYYKNTQLEENENDEVIKDKKTIQKEKSDNILTLDDAAHFGDFDENEIKKEEKEIFNKNYQLNNDENFDIVQQIEINDNEEKKNNQNNIEQKEKEIIFEKKSDINEKNEENKKESKKSLFDNNIYKIGNIFKSTTNNNDIQKESIIFDNNPCKSLFGESEFNKEKKKINLDFKVDNEGYKKEQISFQNNEISNNLKFLSSRGEDSLFGKNDLFGNTGMKKGSFSLFDKKDDSETKNEEIIRKDESENKIEENNKKEKIEKEPFSINIISSKNIFNVESKDNNNEKKGK